MAGMQLRCIGWATAAAFAHAYACMHPPSSAHQAQIMARDGMSSPAEAAAESRVEVDEERARAGSSQQQGAAFQSARRKLSPF